MEQNNDDIKKLLCDLIEKVILVIYGNHDPKSGYKNARYCKNKVMLCEDCHSGYYECPNNSCNY
jgi:hypothetical protein